MTDVLTTVFAFVKQTIGGNRNTWGSILNANFDKVEAGLAGMLEKALTGGSVTLSDTERRNRIIWFSGTLSSNAAITVANQPSVWLVYNGTAGAYTTSMKTSGGAAVEVPQSGWSMVWCDGDDGVYVGPSSALFSTQFKAPDGTIAAPGLGFLNETGLGFRRAGYAAGTLSSNPFTTTNGSPTVTVEHTAHGLAVNDYANLSGATAVGGITPDGLYAVASVPDANHYTITHSSNATSGATGGGTPAYKYMTAAKNAGGAIAVSKGGTDIAHVSPYGVLLTGALYVSGAVKIGGALLGVGAATFGGLLTAAGATLTALLTGTTATLSGLLTLSSTSHWLPPKGTTAQRPVGTTQSASRFNTDLDRPEVQDAGGNWRPICAAQALAGTSKNLVVKNNSGTPNSQIDIDADTVFVETSDGIAYRLDSIDLTINAATNGANGLDASGLSGDQWYYGFVIYNPTTNTKAGLLSLSASSPAMPSGYTAKALVAEYRTSSGNLHRITKRGKRAQYVVSASVTTALPQAITGTSGSVTAPPSWTQQSLANFVPPNASVLHGLLFSQGSGAAICMAAPNNSYGASNSSSNPPPAMVGFASGANGGHNQPFSFLLESSNVYYASNTTGTGIAVRGWETP